MVVIRLGVLSRKVGMGKYKIAVLAKRASFAQLQNRPQVPASRSIIVVNQVGCTHR